MNRQEIIDQAIEAYEMAENEARAQRAADEARRYEDYCVAVQSFLERRLGLSGHIEVLWAGNADGSTFRIAGIGPFKKTHPDYITGINEDAKLVMGEERYMKIDTLADLGDYLVWTGQAQREEVKP